MIRNYRSLGFKDVFEPGAWIPLASGGGVPPDITLDVDGAKQARRATRNRLLGFMTDKACADGPMIAANDNPVQAEEAELAA